MKYLVKKWSKWIYQMCLIIFLFVYLFCVAYLKKSYGASTTYLRIKKTYTLSGIVSSTCVTMSGNCR
jgi:hypothetical protein